MWIETIAPDDAEGRLARIYNGVRRRDGGVDNILRAHSLRPRGLEGHMALYRSAVHAPELTLSGRERELVGVVVSRLNGCAYCVAHHQVGLARYVGEEAEAARLVEAALEGGAGLDPRERALTTYTRKLTQTPGRMEVSDLAPLRAAGLDDGAILDLNQVVAYFAYANRTVLGLGVSTDGEPLGEHSGDSRVSRKV